MNKYKPAGIFLALFFLFSIAVAAMPEPATEFYGNVTLGGEVPAPIGAAVRAFDPEGVLCGSFVIVNTGYYGLLSCNGDDLESATDEGALDGQTIRFEINNLSARPFGIHSWSTGRISRVNLRENHPPTLNPISIGRLSVGVKFNKTITAADPDNDILYFSENTTLFEIGLLTGKIDFVPQASQLGNHSVNF